MSIYCIEFDFCNLGSVKRCLNNLSLNSFPLASDSYLSSSDVLIIPGVGTFGEGISYLQRNGLFNLVKEAHSNHALIIGICLGMQLLFSASDESPDVPGLNLICGDVELLDKSQLGMVPCVGWNEIAINESCQDTVMLNLSSEGKWTQSDYYFVHSFACKPCSSAHQLAYSKSLLDSDTSITAIAAKDNCIGLQFHPEKSGNAGERMLDSILGLR